MVLILQAEYDQVGQAYAAALVELAQSQNVLDQVHADVDGLQSVFKENAQIKEFLQVGSFRATRSISKR